MARILLVDDERDVVTLLRFLLERDGHEVTAAFNGAEALARIDSPAALPELIVLDLMMPVMDGFAVAARLAADARTSAIPIVLMTAKGGLKEALKTSPNIVGGMDKPFDPGKFRSLVAELLKAAKAGRPPSPPTTEVNAK